MAWERKFEQRVIKVRGKELKYLKFTYLTEVSSLISLVQPSLRDRFDSADFIDCRLVRLCCIPDILSQLSFLQFRSATPILVTLISFWHFTVVRRQILTPSIAFTSVSSFTHRTSRVFQ
jgi:uncharacterized membrane protein YwaF